MDFILPPWQLFFMILAGWVNREQQAAIDYLRTENQVLKEKLGKKRTLLNDDQRRRLGCRPPVVDTQWENPTSPWMIDFRAPHMPRSSRRTVAT